MNRLYFGDNLDVLRQHVPNDSVDLIYLDPPFNSKRAYNVLYKSPKGETSEAQMTAFKDTWYWSENTKIEYRDIKNSPYTGLAEMIQGMRAFMHESDLMAYLVMMGRRLMELHRVLKPTGSLYLHCDSTASHYLKIMLDSIFGGDAFRNEIFWKRTSTSTHSDSKRWASVTDTLLYYSKSESFTWNPVYLQQNERHLSDKYRYDDGDGRGLYALDNMTSPNPRPNLMYDWMGYAYPPKGWRYDRTTMQRLHDEGRIHYPEDKAQRPRLKRYLNEQKGRLADNAWLDIAPLNSQAVERLGYPTQKPLALLERIIKASSNPGDLVLDPFCGCGTTVHAAQSLGRDWIGIDITHMAIHLIERRLRAAFPEIIFKTEGLPEDLDGARDLAKRDKYQFQWWACSLVGAQPYQGKKKGADGGIDGLIFFTDAENGKRVDRKIVVSVKGGENVTVTMLRDLIAVMQQNNADIGLFVTLTDPTQPMMTEAARAGVYRGGNGRDYPRVQILTIDDLLSGRKHPQFLDMSLGQETFKQSPVDKPDNDQPKLF